MSEVTSPRMKSESFIFDTWRLSGFPSSKTVKDLKNKSCPDPAGAAVPWKAAIFADNTCILLYHDYHVTDFITITYYDGIVSYFAFHCLQVIILYHMVCITLQTPYLYLLLFTFLMFFFFFTFLFCSFTLNLPFVNFFFFYMPHQHFTVKQRDMWQIGNINSQTFCFHRTIRQRRVARQAATL